MVRLDGLSVFGRYFILVSDLSWYDSTQTRWVSQSLSLRRNYLSKTQNPGKVEALVRQCAG